jgi:hypothetical protein
MIFFSLEWKNTERKEGRIASGCGAQEGAETLSNTHCCTILDSSLVDFEVGNCSHPLPFVSVSSQL